MAARCEAAGRKINEDNFQLSDNLESDHWGFVTNQEVTLGEKGALLVVCDGMGGMKAGATASDLAVKTIKEWFTNSKLTPQVMATHETIIQYIEEAIISADEKIKEAGRHNKELEGMGSTLVLAWIVRDNVYIGWCGDSRAYRFNAASGLERLSHDHSYVQELVDRGKLSKHLAFEHPDNNIITRSLGDTRKTVQPDVKKFQLDNGDIILLCSDGLSGVLPDEAIETIILNNCDTMVDCRNALWTESENVGWTDNVTIALCQIVSGIENADKEFSPFPVEEKIGMTEVKRRKFGILLFIFLFLVLVGIAFEVGHFLGKGCWWFPKALFSIGNN